jgi:hypothetical protein
MSEYSEAFNDAVALAQCYPRPRGGWVVLRVSTVIYGDILKAWGCSRVTLPCDMEISGGGAKFHRFRLSVQPQLVNKNPLSNP